ncbi:flagellar hook-length control protein FliK [Polaromonas sp.]|uniref:flagellar hook-length control protein FliK n=1 Tax=Polaromonas sp. TaxID=1869339 RepID=UPI0013BCE882|nr:flagellar hook-length control protein FliK [Polaromonas sp.]NDP63952.1 flagellar hook-length control protein FliK [Polaromonas sp.]
MSGLTPLVDTLLATRLAQRVDLVPLKPEVQLAGPGPVTQVEEVINDVRLPSRAAVEQQLGVGPLKSGLRGHGDISARPDQAVTLSAAARAVSAILDGHTGAAARVIGSGPLLPSSQLPPSPVIAETLARTVSRSGLFYESHLAQFAAGARSLAELAQEPQSRMEGILKAATVQADLPEGAGPDGERAVAPLNSRAAQPVMTQADEAAPGGSNKPGVAVPPPPANDPESARLAPGLEAAHAHKSAYASMQEADGSTPAAKSHDDSATHAARGTTPALAGIHQDAVALVRQQLELLAQPVFRWSGEAWPAVSMDWEIREDERQAAIGDEAMPRSWSTRLALTLPTLRNIEVRISLTGDALQVRLAASEDVTQDRLREARAELPERLSALGLELTSLQIGSLAEPTEPADANTPKADDGD